MAVTVDSSGFLPLKVHYPRCKRPGMLWHEPIRGLPTMGHCPDCGAVARRPGEGKARVHKSRKNTTRRFTAKRKVTA